MRKFAAEWCLRKKRQKMTEFKEKILWRNKTTGTLPIAAKSGRFHFDTVSIAHDSMP